MKFDDFLQIYLFCKVQNISDSLLTDFNLMCVEHLRLCVDSIIIAGQFDDRLPETKGMIDLIRLRIERNLVSEIYDGRLLILITSGIRVTCYFRQSRNQGKAFRI